MRYHSIPAVVICAAAAASAGLVVTQVYAADYLSIADAKKLMFADATEFAPYPLHMSADQQKAIEAKAGGPLRPAGWVVWQAKKGDTVLGYVVTDAVLGKFELISYAVALNTDATIRSVEILAYRESHGFEVRNQAWRNQFVGKSAKAPLRIGDDIANISGATLSCTHLTDGVRRIATWAQLALVHA
ncbi:FMN-binding protein [Andreprevotia chitinilytica]|uniref:FMN-binding protein n=1 Tax=Andreprevotia chitinilytica TaxID=396808 RepID=UPI00054DA21B|nr:FMN-binding protein [Andreprevotia chitinilytica]